MLYSLEARELTLKMFLSYGDYREMKNLGYMEGETQGLKAVPLKLYCVHELPETCLKTQILIQQFGAKDQNWEFLTIFQVLPMPLVYGPHFEEPSF